MKEHGLGPPSLRDRAALEDMSCECYAVVRHNIDKIFPPSHFEITNESACR